MREILHNLSSRPSKELRPVGEEGHKDWRQNESRDVTQDPRSGRLRDRTSACRGGRSEVLPDFDRATLWVLGGSGSNAELRVFERQVNLRAGALVYGAPVERGGLTTVMPSRISFQRMQEMLKERWGDQYRAKESEAVDDRLEQPT